MHNAGMTFDEIGKVFNISRQRAHYIFKTLVNKKQEES